MQNDRFDELTKLFAQPIPRRRAFKIVVASVLGAAFSGFGSEAALAVTCPTGQTLCSGRCKNLSTDPLNCGACGKVCPSGAQCVNKICKCPSGQVVCKGEDRNYCAKKCCAYSSGDCEEMKSSGTFSITVPQTAITLRGAASPQTSGTVVSVAKVTMPHSASNIHAFKIVTSGRFPTLKLATKGKLHQYNPATGKMKTVAAVTKAGIYVVLV